MAKSSKKAKPLGEPNPDNTLHIYTRVSTTTQAESGTSLKTQLELGTEKANQLGFFIRHWAEGGKSSHHEDMANREQLYNLFTAIKEGNVKHLWVYDQSRISRNDKVASIFRYECNKQGVTLYTNGGVFDLSNPQDSFLKSILDTMAVFENAQRAERTRLGKWNRVDDGLWHGGVPPFGYTIKNKKLAIEPKEARWVRRIFTEAKKGTSVKEIKSLLDSYGVPTRHGKGSWSLGSIQAILNHTCYKGFYIYTDSKTEKFLTVQCDGIVDTDTWDSIHNARKQSISRRSQKNATHKHFYLLRDLMYCGHCERQISGRIKPSKNEAMYYCPNKERDWVKNGGTTEPWQRGRGCGFERSMNLPQTDALVWDYVKGIHQQSHTLREQFKSKVLKEKGLDKEINAEEVAAIGKRIKRFQEQLQDADVALGRLEANRLRGRFGSEESYQVAHKVLASDVDAFAKKLADERLKLKGLTDKKRWFDWLRVFGEELVAKDNLTDEQRKAYLVGLIERIDVKYLAESRAHELRIHFKLPIVGDTFEWTNYKKRTYKLADGSQEGIVTVSKKDGRG